MDTLVEAELGRERRRAIARRKRRTERVARTVPEVYVVPDGMVDVALRELGARLVTDDSEPTRLRPAA